jgi:hypothetical protein
MQILNFVLRKNRLNQAEYKSFDYRNISVKFLQRNKELSTDYADKSLLSAVICVICGRISFISGRVSFFRRLFFGIHQRKTL